MRIGDREIGPGEPCYIIAEIGCNHGGRRDVALRMVDEAARCGADAAKFQTFDVDKLTSDLDEKRRLRPLQLTGDDHRALMLRCREIGIEFLSTPFDEESAEFLECLGVRALKIASGDATNLPLLRKCASLGLPIVASVGMCGSADIMRMLDVFVDAEDLALLYCVSCYPTAIDNANLGGIAALWRLLYGHENYEHAVVGYSDHTSEIAVGVTATVLGATILEKHFTLSPRVGVDAAISLAPRSFKMMVDTIRDGERAILGGDGYLGSQPCEEPCRRRSRRSWAAARDLTPGHVIEDDDLYLLRPGMGFNPGRLRELVGRTVGPPIRKGTMLTEGDLS